MVTTDMRAAIAAKQTSRRARQTEVSTLVVISR
jgi:hypothetical protein